MDRELSVLDLSVEIVENLLAHGEFSELNKCVEELWEVWHGPGVLPFVAGNLNMLRPSMLFYSVTLSDGYQPWYHSCPKVSVRPLYYICC